MANQNPGWLMKTTGNMLQTGHTQACLSSQAVALCGLDERIMRRGKLVLNASHSANSHVQCESVMR